MASGAEEYSSKYRRTLLEQSNYLNCGLEQQMKNWDFRTETDMMEEMARIEGLIGKTKQAG